MKIWESCVGRQRGESGDRWEMKTEDFQQSLGGEREAKARMQLQAV